MPNVAVKLVTLRRTTPASHVALKMPKVYSKSAFHKAHTTAVVRIPSLHLHLSAAANPLQIVAERFAAMAKLSLATRGIAVMISTFLVHNNGVHVPSMGT
jgi:hypothetical protein